jgi:Tol biopolymer transport system component
VDRQGRDEPLDAQPRAYYQPRLSPDGTRVAIASADEEQDLWIWDVARKKLNQLTFNSALDLAPLWTPDSQRLVFSSARAGAPNLYVQPADGTGSERRLTDSPNPQFATGVTPDGTRVVFFEATPTQSRNLRLLTLTPAPQVAPLVETSFEERNGVVSSDGRWLAYESNRSGRFEIYVQPFISGGEGLWKISTAGGVQPLWSPPGRELFYLAPDGALNGVSVEARGATWSNGAPSRLLEGRYFTGAGNVSRQYDVTADGQRFLRIKDDPANADSSAQIIVVLNWTEELKRLVPTR